jgi:hypothetical protein
MELEIRTIYNSEDEKENVMIELTKVYDQL